MIPPEIKKYLDREGCGYHEGLPVPQPDEASMDVCRRFCEENLCGSYGRNWGCPPHIGDGASCIERCVSYGSCFLVTVPVDCGFDEKEKLAESMARAQGIAREVKRKLARAGIKSLTMADGPCSYCDVCSCVKGDPCTHPDNMVPSASGFGIMVKDYLESVGIPTDDPPNFYCFVLI